MNKRSATFFIPYYIIMILLTCTLMCACSTTVQNKANTTSANQSSEIREFEKPDAAQFNNDKINICLITKSYGSNYWDTLIQGAVDSAAQNDVNLYIAGVQNENDTDNLAYLMDEALKLKPDAIIVSPADTKNIYSSVDKINAANIPLIYVDTILNGQQFDACFMTDNMAAGRMVAQDMIKKLEAMKHSADEKICVGINIGSKKSQTIIERLAGFNEYWSSNAPSDWTVIEPIFCNDGNADIAYEQALTMINEHSNLAGLIGLNNGSTVGLSRALSKSKRKDLVLVGFDYSDEVAVLIADKEYSVSTLVQSQYNMGYESVQRAIEIHNGQTPAFKYFDTGVVKIDHNNYTSPYIKSLVSATE